MNNVLVSSWKWRQDDTEMLFILIRIIFYLSCE